jgi:hypothetical protein
MTRAVNSLREKKNTAGKRQKANAEFRVGRYVNVAEIKLVRVRLRWRKR